MVTYNYDIFDGSNTGDWTGDTSHFNSDSNDQFDGNGAHGELDVDGGTNVVYLDLADSSLDTPDSVKGDTAFAIQNNGTFRARVELQDATGNTLVYVEVENDNGHGEVQANGTKVGDYTDDVWYYVEIRNPDFTNETFDVYVDGDQEATGMSFQESATAIEQVRFLNESSAFGLADLDAVQTRWTPKQATGLEVADTRAYQIDLTYDDLVGESEYHVYRAQQSGGGSGGYTQVATLSADDTTFTDTGLENGEQFFYRVAGANEYGEGDLSSEVQTTTLTPAPTIDSLSVDENEITIDWTKNDNSTDGNYEVLRRTPSGSFGVVQTIGDLSTTSWTDTGLDYEQEYEYQIRRNTDHDTSTSGTASATTNLLPANNVTIDASAENEITLGWDKQDSDSGGEWEIYRSTESGTLGSKVADGVAVSARSYTDTTVEDGVTYFYTIRRVVGSASADSVQVSQTTQAPPPKNISATVREMVIDVSWSDESDSETEFEILVKQESDSSYTIVRTVGANVESATINPAQTGTLDIRVRAVLPDTSATSSTVTVSYTGNPANYGLVLTDPDGNVRYLDDEAINRLDIQTTHTALGDWRVWTQYDLSLENWLFSEVDIKYQSAYLFRGYLELVESDNKASTSEIGGRGIGKELAEGEASTTYTNTPAHEAIQDYWDSHTTFNANVVTPSTTEKKTDATLGAADSEAEWSDLVSPVATDPVAIDSAGQLRTEQTCFVHEGENWDDNSGAATNTLDPYSGGSLASIGDTGTDYVAYNFTPQYTIPADHVNVAVRMASDNQTSIQVKLNGDIVETSQEQLGADGADPTWFTGLCDTNVLNDAANTSDSDEAYSSGDLAADQQHTVTVDIIDAGEHINPCFVDVVAVYDDRYDYTWDDDNGGNGGYLEGPETKPDAVPVLFDLNNTTLNITEIAVDSAFVDDNVSNQQKWVVSNDATLGSEFQYNNTETFTKSFGDPGIRPYLQVTLSRYGSRTGETPTTGFNGQAIDSVDVTYDANDLAVIDDQTFEGDHLSNLQRLHEVAGMRWTVSYAPDSKTVESYQVGDVSKTLEWTYAEFGYNEETYGDFGYSGTKSTEEVVKNRRRRVDVQGYANHVTVRGRRDDNGSRETATVEDEAEIDDVGKQHHDVIDPSLSSEGDVKSAARKSLSKKLNRDRKVGTLEVVPISVEPGYTYTITWSDGSTSEVPLESVSYADEARSASGTLKFDLDADVAETIAQLKRENQRTKNAL